MKHFIVTIALWSMLITPSWAQKKYFQQEVNYEIDVQLDDENHILRAFESFRYINHSPDTLSFIFIHLYPNAYKNDRTAFTKQKVESGDTKFYYSKENDRGFIDSLNFRANDFPINMRYYNTYEDIAVLELVSPLIPGDSVTITTPFRVIIPKNFSRLGHEGQTYQITQWFPKPAVYDRDGWHPLPYLDQGEFYSDFGSYKVSITLPENYVVASTGDLQDASEWKFLQSKTLDNEKDINYYLHPNLVSSSKFKTIHYTQKNVHDFAWFADKRFIIEQEKFELGNGQKCTALSFITPGNIEKYQGSAHIISETVKYLSQHVGNYPYNYVSVVDGPLYAGGGMEYPNVAIIGKVSNKQELKTVIIHEVGHNWFQGILGNNERENPWMDEGINTFYENKIEELLSKKVSEPKIEVSNDIIYFLNGYARKDQPIQDHAEKYTSINYGGVVYSKAAKALTYLEAYLGEDVFEQAMKSYFDTWKFKHPQPADFRNHIEKFTNKDVQWFFKDLMYTTDPLDFKIKKISGDAKNITAIVQSKGNKNYPVPVSAMQGDSIISTVWTIENEANFGPLPEGITHFKLDVKKLIPEINFVNNTFKPNAIFKRGTPKFRLISSVGTKPQNKLFFIPSIGYNAYDKFSIGLGLHNISIPNREFQFALAPIYSFATKSLVGTGVVGYTFYPKKNFYRIILSGQMQSFHYNESSLNISSPIRPRFYKFLPSLRMELNEAELRSPRTRVLEAKLYLTGKQNIAYKYDTGQALYQPYLSNYDKFNFLRLRYTHKMQSTFNPYQYSIYSDVNSNFMKLGAEASMKADYFLKNKGLYVRAFAGKYFYLNATNNPFDLKNTYLNLCPTAENDYGYDNYFIARSSFSGWTSQQIINREGGFVSRTTKYANPLGVSDNWIAAVNIESDLPFKYLFLPKVFFNAGGFANAHEINPSGSRLLYEGGLKFSLIKDIIQINIPLVLSKDLKTYSKNVYSKNKILQQISFSISTDKLDFLRTQDLIKLFIK